MATPRTEIMRIVARVRRVWGNESVERGGGSSGWLFRITTPKGREPARIQIHSSPSDRNWYKHVMDSLRDAGFEEDEQLFIEQEAERKRAEAEASMLKNEEKLRVAQENAAKLASSLRAAAGPYAPQVADIGWIFARHELPETRRVLITPELAEKILDEL